MTLEEIKNAVRAGKKVHWANEGYEIVLSYYKSGEEHWVINCIHNDSCIGLTWLNGVTLNGKEYEFFIKN